MRTATAQTTAPLPDLTSVADIRGHFPALERKNDGRQVAYFDGPGL
jgi:selenocysteine lyase/cysteine desulfurase